MLWIFRFITHWGRGYNRNVPTQSFYRSGAFARHPSFSLFASTVALAFAHPALAGCENTVDAQAIEELLAEAESALSALDVSTFKALVDGVDGLIPCMSEPIPPRLAAQYHRVYGIRALGGRDPIADRAFAAARYIEPKYQFSKSLIPEGNPIRAAYDRATFDQRSAEPMPAPKDGAMLIDGSVATERPISWPAFVQWVDEDQVHFTTYALPGQSLPEYPVFNPNEQPVRKAPVGLVVGAVGAGVLSGALYTAALVDKARYNDTVNNPVPDDDLDGLRKTTNGLVVASAISATAAVGTSVAIVVAW